MLAGLPADLGVAVAAFVGTNIDNAVVTMAMVASAPPARARRIAIGQLIGFAVLVGVAAATAIALFEFSARQIGLLGLVPLALGLRGLWQLRDPAQRDRVARRAVGSGLVAAVLVTVGAGGDNLAAYIPLFRAAGLSMVLTLAAVFVLGEALLTVLVLRSGGHPRARAAVTRLGVVATPLLYCVIGVLVLAEAGTFHLVA